MTFHEMRWTSDSRLRSSAMTLIRAPSLQSLAELLAACFFLNEHAACVQGRRRHFYLFTSSHSLSETCPRSRRYHKISHIRHRTEAKMLGCRNMWTRGTLIDVTRKSGRAWVVVTPAASLVEPPTRLSFCSLVLLRVIWFADLVNLDSIE